MRRTACILAAVCALAGAAGPARALNYHKVRTLAEPLGHTWTEELVHLDHDVREAKVRADTFSVTLNEERPVPVQVEVLKGTPEAVRKVRLWFRLTLPRGEEVSVRITYNDEGRAAPAVGDGPRAAVTREKDALVLSTDVAEVRIPASADLARRKATLADVPPLSGLRPAGARRWAGRVRVEGGGRLARVEATVEAEGPVFFRVRLRYAFREKDRAYEAVFRGTAGEPWIDVLETYRLGEGARMTLALDRGLDPVEALWIPWFVWDGRRAKPVNDLVRLALEDKVGPEPFTTLRPKWTQARDSAQALLAVGAGADDPSVGVLMTSPADWEDPYRQLVTARVPKRGSLLLGFPLEGGARHWAVLAGPAARFDTKGELQHLMRRNADIPLDRVLNEWRFRWRRDPKAPAPHILTTWERLQALRADIAKDRDTPAVRMLKRVLEGEAEGDRRLAEFLAGKREELGAGSPGGGIYLDRAYQDDFFNPTTLPRRTSAGMRMADLAAAGRPAGGPGTALLGYVFSDPNYWPGYAKGWGVGNPNFHTDMYKNALYAASMMPDHPHARRWMTFGIDNLRDDLARVVHMPGGAGQECPGYHAYAFRHMLEMMLTIQNSGLGDPFKWPEVRATAAYLRHMHTPPDPRLGRRTLASLGDTHAWQEGAGVVFGLLATGTRKSDPDFAGRCMGLYRHYYGDEGTGDLVDDVLLVDQTTPATPLKRMDWGSHAFPGFGAQMRSRFGSPREAFVTFKCGPARGHYQGDELSFHFYGAATPVALDWHCGYHPRPDQEHMHNRVNLGDDENMDAVGEMLAFRSTDVADVAVGQVVSDRLRKMPRYAHEIVWQAAYPRRTLEREARYRRFLMLVKHPDGSRLQDYLVLRDELATDEPATFNLFTLSRRVRQEGRRFRCEGQLGTDALLFVATPEPRKVRTDRWSWPERGDSSLIPKDFDPKKSRWTRGEWQPWLRISAEPGRPFLTLLYPRPDGEPAPEFEPLAEGRGIRVRLGTETEDVYLATEAPGDVGGQAVVVRGTERTVVLNRGTVGPLAPEPKADADE